MWATGTPSRRTISSSKSRNARPSRLATRRPSMDFPAPGSPTRIRCGLLGVNVDSGGNVGQVRVVVALRLFERIAAELLEKRLRDDERHHGLGDHAHGRHGGDITPL